MHRENLTAYLKDHFAGSVAALELLDHLITTDPDEHLRQFFSDLHREIQADQNILRDLLVRFDAEESSARRAAAWMAEKVGWLKLQLAGLGEEGSGLLQALEALVLGIDGKRALWRALQNAPGRLPELQGVDFARLIRRAEEQGEKAEARRLDAARIAFSEQPVEVH